MPPDAVRATSFAPSINVETLDPALEAHEIATELVENAGLDTVDDQFIRLRRHERFDAAVAYPELKTWQSWMNGNARARHG